MNWDVESLLAVLCGTITKNESPDDRFMSYEIRFEDHHLKYAIHLMPNYGAAQISADPVEPNQPCPALEYGFSCNEIEIGESAYGSKDGKAIRFYEHRKGFNELRLTLTPRGDGNWYLWASAGKQQASDQLG